MTPPEWHERAKQILQREQGQQPQQGPTDCGAWCRICDACVQFEEDLRDFGVRV